MELIVYFRCKCGKDWTGKNCTDRIDNCKSHICQNGARCIDGPGTYSCLCTNGYTGRYCGIPPVRNQIYSNKGPCQRHDCQNNGVCHPQKGNKEYSCQCVSGKKLNKTIYHFFL